MNLMSYNYIRARNASWRNISLVRELILRRSNPYVHSELQFGATFGNISFSATMEDHFKGCRFKKISYSSPFWDCVTVPATPQEEQMMFRRAMVFAGVSGMKPETVTDWCLQRGWAYGADARGYDLIGLLSFGTPLKIIVPDRKKMWCSETCVEVIQTCKPMGIVADRTHPAKLHFVAAQLFSTGKADRNKILYATN